MKKKNNKKIILGSITTIIILTIVIMIISSACSIMNLEGKKVSIVNETSLETSIITIKNIFSKEGIKFIFSNVLNNFKTFEPLVMLIIALIATGIGEASGLFQAIFQPFKRIKPVILTFFIVFIGVISSAIGEYSYIMLFPLVGILYKTIGKNPFLGIISVFLGITLGYGTGLVNSFNDWNLGQLTQIAATIDVDKNYIYSLSSTFFINISSTIIFSFLLSVLIDKNISPKLTHKHEKEEELIFSKKALYFSNFAFVFMLLLLIYMIIPNLYGSGILLDLNQKEYVMKLFSSTAPFQQGFFYIVLFMMMVCGCIYGKISGNIKNSPEYTKGLSKTFEKTGGLFVIMFFTSQLVSILNWTNFGQVISARIVDLMSTLQISGVILIVIVFLLIVLMGVLLPSTTTKWELTSPVAIPLLMRSNMTPDFSQFVFRIADGMGKVITPTFTYFLIMIGFLDKYNLDDENHVTVFGIFKLIFPTVLACIGIWLLIIVGWYIVGLPIGMGTYPTL